MPDQVTAHKAGKDPTALGKSRFSRRLFPGLSSLKASEDLPVRAHWRRIFILPTAAGLFFGFSLMLMLVASLNFNNNMGLMLTFWAMGLAQVLLLATFLNLLNIRLTGLHAEPVHAGDPARVQLKLKAPEKRSGIHLSWSPAGKRKTGRKADARPFGGGTRTETGVTTAIDSSGSTVVLPLATSQRGWKNIPRLKICTRHPAGLFTAWVYARPRQKILVYPQAEINAPPWALNAHGEGVTWHHTSGDDFDGVRPYQYGDPLRLVAWKRSAQAHDLVSREYHSNSGERVSLDWSQVQHLPLEQAVSRLTAWVIKADGAGLNYCLKLPGFDSGDGQGHTHRHHCLRALATHGLRP